MRHHFLSSLLACTFLLAGYSALLAAEPVGQDGTTYDGLNRGQSPIYGLKLIGDCPLLIL